MYIMAHWLSNANLIFYCIYMFVCLCFTSLQERGHLETAPPFTVPCERREVR